MRSQMYFPNGAKSIRDGDGRKIFQVPFDSRILCVCIVSKWGGSEWADAYIGTERHLFVGEFNRLSGTLMIHECNRLNFDLHDLYPIQSLFLEDDLLKRRVLLVGTAKEERRVRLGADILRIDELPSRAYVPVSLGQELCSCRSRIAHHVRIEMGESFDVVLQHGAKCPLRRVPLEEPLLAAWSGFYLPTQKNNAGNVERFYPA